MMKISLRVIAAVALAAVAMVLAAPASLVAALHLAPRAPHRLRQTGSGWPQCCATCKQFSGYFDINSTTNKHYFYWGIGPRSGSSGAGAKTIIWLTGGPGCSSMAALLYENGPCKINTQTNEMYDNPWGWNKDALVIWVDQPAGVGYSYSDQSGADSDEAQVGRDMNDFVQALLKANPSWQQNEFFVVGESYGGHYAMSVSSAIFNNNKNLRPGEVHVNLVGVATGNGLTAPVIQYQYYIDLVWHRCKEVLGQPCVSQFAYDSMNASIPGCVKACQECDNGNALACQIGRMSCNGGELDPYMETGRNPYDIRKQCGPYPLCYNFDAIHAFLNRADVKAALGADPSVTWHTCNMTVNQQFGGDWLHRFDLLLQPMLDGSNIRFVQYSGDMDFICNYIGNFAWVKALDWSGKQAFGQAPQKQWNAANNSIAGWVQSVPGTGTPIKYSFVRVAEAGHMSPADQPENVFNMMDNFINNRPFV